MFTLALLCTVNLIFVFCLICWLGRLGDGLRKIDDKAVSIMAENAVIKADNRELRHELKLAKRLNDLKQTVRAITISLLFFYAPIAAWADVPIEIPSPSPAPELPGRASPACWEAYLSCATTQRDMRKEQIDCTEVIAHLGSVRTPLLFEDDITFRMSVSRAYAAFTTEEICQAHVYHCHLGLYQVWHEIGACYRALKKALRVVK